MQLANDMMVLDMAPDLGARITSLRDKRSGREWLVQGSVAPTAVEDALFDGTVAWGWDECFPSVAPATGDGFGWDRVLRDHGALWGRPWDCTLSDDMLTARYSGAMFSFTRELSLDGPDLVARYTLHNSGEKPFGYLYSQHMLLALEAGETFSASGIGGLFPDGTIPNDDAPALDEETSINPVRALSAGIAVKRYARVAGRASVTCGGANGTLTFSWVGDELPAMGMWASYGGWPEHAPVHQVAVEPTSAPADRLSPASATWLPPAASHRWTIRITLADGGGAAKEM